ncbi:hypothetical protein CAMGR0001_0627 [Campylobacter gracilis RM3268]|uniref:Uncharacterized protein n=1 Tax=Campylobacter gracilis RM3268 TaxID=553220 RepID=C8PDS1_9BACT|nr:hypothetical protein CAMGR0001_0627 [Campylobacter gracilis RM3268]
MRLFRREIAWVNFFHLSSFAYKILYNFILNLLKIYKYFYKFAKILKFNLNL